MKKLFLLAVVVISVLLQSCASVVNFMDPNGPEYRGFYASIQNASDDDIKVVSYNIAWAKEIDAAIDELTSLSALKDADLLLLQEMDVTAADRIARAVSMNYVYYPGCIHNMNDKDIGNAILSRWPISDEKKIIFPHKQSWNDRIRTATVATVHIAERRVRVYNVHTATVLMSEANQLDQLESVVDDMSGDYDKIIVGGDFNTARPGSVQRAERLFEEAGFVYATDDVGYTARAFGLFRVTLDHIFTRGMNVLDCGVAREAKASDHLPLWTRLRFNESPTPLASGAKPAAIIP